MMKGIGRCENYPGGAFRVLEMPFWSRPNGYEGGTRSGCTFRRAMIGGVALLMFLFFVWGVTGGGGFFCPLLFLGVLQFKGWGFLPVVVH